MEPQVTNTLVTAGLNELGAGAYIPVAFAVIGLFSAVATVYPQTWPGASIVHSIALLFGKATPATPAGSQIISTTTVGSVTTHVTQDVSTATPIIPADPVVTKYPAPPTSHSK